MPYLIDDKYLADNTSVDVQTKPKVLKVAMQAVTVINMKPLLGLPLYEFYEQFVVGVNELSPKQAELFVSIQYYMALRVEREMLYNLLSVNNKGVTQDEHVANMAVVTAKRQDVESESEFVKGNILAYLEANREDFPEYFPEPTSTTPKTTDYSSGIVFDYQPKRYFM